LLYSYEILFFISLCSDCLGGKNEAHQLQSVEFLFAIWAALLIAPSCEKPAVQPTATAIRPSDIKVEVRDGRPVVLTTGAAEFQVLPSGQLQGTLLKDGKRLTLDEQGSGASAGGDFIVHEGKTLEFTSDFAKAKILDATGKLGRGKRVEIPALASAAGTAIERTTAIETYDDFPISRWSASPTKIWGPRILRSTRRWCSSIVSTRSRPMRKLSPMTCGISGIELRLGQG